MSFTAFFKMIFATITAIFTLIGGIFVPTTESSICMIAHRGYSGKYPENTALAFEKAYENGSGGCETDVRITKDGVFVLSHNSSVVLEDGTELEVSDSTYEELTAQPLKNKKTKDEVYLCTFEKYIEIMKSHNMICFIELKGSYTDKQVKEVFTIAEEKYDLSKCILQSFDFDNLVKAREQFPDLPIMLTYSKNDGDWQKCIDYGFSIDTEYTALTEEMVTAFHNANLEVAVWTANSYPVLYYCKSMGVDYIESDYFGK